MIYNITKLLMWFTFYQQTITAAWYRYFINNFICSIPCIKVRFIKKKLTNALVTYVRCLLITLIGFCRFLRPSLWSTVTKSEIKSSNPAFLQKTHQTTTTTDFTTYKQNFYHLIIFYIKSFTIL